jgi:hypothetical protein
MQRIYQTPVCAKSHKEREKEKGQTAGSLASELILHAIALST